MDCLKVDNQLGEKVTEFKNLLRQECDSYKAESAALKAEDADTCAQEESSVLQEKSLAYKSFLENVQAKAGEVKQDADTLALIAECEEKARNLFASNVSLAVLPGSETEISKILDGSSAAAVRGQGATWTAVLLDPSQWGEAITSPHIRTPPLNLGLLKQFMNAVIMNRDKQGLQLQNRDMVVYFDGFSSGNTPKAMSSIQNSSGTQISKNIMQVYLSYDEESLRARRQYVKINSTVFQQIEVMSIMTHDPFNEAMTYRARTFFKGSSLGNKIGDINLDAPAALWSLPLKDLSLLRVNFICRVCGRSAG